MKHFLSILKVGSWLLLAAACPLAAQQNIVFSKPADASTDKSGSFGNNSRSSRVNADSYKAPVPFFNDYTPPASPQPPVYLQNNDSTVRDALNKRKNWTLLTPEQILGIQTPEQILGVKNKEDEKLTLEQKFLLREDRSSATNGRAMSAMNRNDADNPFIQKREQPGVGFRNENDARDKNYPSGPASFFNQLAKVSAQSTFASANQKESSPWANGLAPAMAPQAASEQAASMERFRAMMEPTAQPAKPVESATWKAAAPPVDPYLQVQPKVNPAGMGVAPLENNSARPTGIQPLPGVTGQPKAPQNSRPAWQAQLPPWMSDKPQPNRNKRF